MRIFLKLRASKDSKFVSINNNYALSSTIYNFLKFGSPQFSNFLHEVGYSSNHKTYKLFSFAIKYESVELEKNALRLKSPIAYLYITTTLVDDFIKNFIIGTFENQIIEVYSEYIRTKFLIDQIEVLPDPKIEDTMNFKMITPLVLSNYSIHKPTVYFLRYDDDIKLINKIFNQNMINKFEAVYHRKYEGSGVSIQWNHDYAIKTLKKGKRLSKKVTINKDIKNPKEIVGIFCPFKINSDTKLIELGYNIGFGEKNSMGFGMVYHE